MEFRAAIELWLERGEIGRLEKGENAETIPLVEGDEINGDLTAIVIMQRQ